MIVTSMGAEREMSKGCLDGLKAGLKAAFAFFEIYLWFVTAVMALQFSMFSYSSIPSCWWVNALQHLFSCFALYLAPERVYWNIFTLTGYVGFVIPFLAVALVFLNPKLQVTEKGIWSALFCGSACLRLGGFAFLAYLISYWRKKDMWIMFGMLPALMGTLYCVTIGDEIVAPFNDAVSVLLLVLGARNVFLCTRRIVAAPDNGVAIAVNHAGNPRADQLVKTNPERKTVEQIVDTESDEGVKLDINEKILRRPPDEA